MKHGWLVAVTTSFVMLSGAAAVLGVGQSVLRTLSVEQTTIKDVSPPAGGTASVSDALDVVAWVDRPDSTYARGERVRMFVQTSKDAYVTILNVDPAGATTVLFPNQYQSDNMVRANHSVEVPDPDSLSQVVVGGTVGTELVKIIASTEPVPLFEDGQLSDAGPFQMVTTRPAGTARSLTVTMTETPASSATVGSLDSAATEWAMCHQTIVTIPAPSVAEQRTRSLQVLRTGENGGSVTCDEAGG